jgi:hypothetical protein
VQRIPHPTACNRHNNSAVAATSHNCTAALLTPSQGAIRFSHSQPLPDAETTAALSHLHHFPSAEQKPLSQLPRVKLLFKVRVTHKLTSRKALGADDVHGVEESIRCRDDDV